MFVISVNVKQWQEQLASHGSQEDTFLMTCAPRSSMRRCMMVGGLKLPQLSKMTDARSALSPWCCKQVPSLSVGSCTSTVPASPQAALAEALMPGVLLWFLRLLRGVEVSHLTDGFRRGLVASVGREVTTEGG